MISSQKIFFTLALLLVPGTLRPIQYLPDIQETGKVVACLFGAGASLWGINKASETSFVKNFCENTGISKEDLKNVAGISSSLFWLGHTLQLRDVSNEFARGCKHLAYMTPVAASVAKVTSTTTFNDIAQHAPLIGKYAKCSNAKCKGVCTSCQLTKGTMLIGTYAGIRAAVPMFFPIITSKLRR